jgi:type VI secretion system secreted protein VgrG
MAGSVFLGATAAYAAQGPVGLGTATSFAVLAGSGITNTGPTTITGDTGTFPTPAETGFTSITLHGTNHAGDAVTQGAKNDLVAAYNDAAGRTPVTNVAVELGGSTLLAGVYASPTLGLTGTLTLDGQGSSDAEFIFQAGSTLITASNSRVLLVNGADPCHVVWQVGSSATFNTGTRFVGDVLALTSISAQTGATFEGRLLARNGAVTLDTNTITNANCASGSGTTTTTSPATEATPPAADTTPTTDGSANQTTPLIPSGGTPTIVSLAPEGAPGTPSTPAATPGAPGVPGSPTGPPNGPPGSPSAPPFLARTGQNVVGFAATGLALLVLGGHALASARRRRATHGF